MYFKNEIAKLIKDKEGHLFVDMDGVIADYEIGQPLDFKNKRPLFTNIKTLEEIADFSNINMYILSVCIKDNQIIDKNNWLDQYAPFFKKENRIIISKESYPDLSTKELKEFFLKSYINKIDNGTIIVLDDDNEILKYLSRKYKNIIFFQDSSIID